MNLVCASLHGGRLLFAQSGLVVESRAVLGVVVLMRIDQEKRSMIGCFAECLVQPAEEFVRATWFVHVLLQTNHRVTV